MILEFQNMPTSPSRNLQKEIAQITTLSHVFFSGFDIQAATVQLS